jgi:membrane-bound lytic murein transglycosylase D
MKVFSNTLMQARTLIADKTVVNEHADATQSHEEAPAIKVTWVAGGEKHTQEFVSDGAKAVTVGRSLSCDVRVDDGAVSRQHLRIFVEAGQWYITDLNSGNGTLLDGVRVEKAILPSHATLRLGRGGPKLWIDVPGASDGASVDEFAEHYFGDPSDDEAGHRTLMVRRAFRKVDNRHKRRNRGIMFAAAAVLILSAGIGVDQFLMLQETRQLGVNMFYEMKSVQVQIARLEDAVRASGDSDRLADFDARRTEMSAMAAQYDQLLDELGVMGSGLSDEDRIILRVARMFGECELDIPEGFAREVKNYIQKWKATGRLKQAIARMNRDDLVPLISAAMLENNLPPQFLYLALLESDFNAQAVGPETRFGIAKGIWQFMPATAWDYDLSTGPLVEVSRHDPLDERFDVELATYAAARYLRDIYSHEAQASGLLVIASYNWGPTNIRKRIREMPDNPRERNFWQLLKQHDIPQETYDYVFYIVSAIVIGEDPELFGFDFENPLKV